MAVGKLIVCIHFISVVWGKTIETTHGNVKGTVFALSNGRNVNAFLGIPYAAPPIGENRYAPPQPVQPWSETLNADTLPKGCIQGASAKEKKTIFFLSESPESEDCLYLNIWTPDNPNNEKLPVMIWIFSGGFFGGASNLPMYDGRLLASEQRVIVVSMNYRLTQFGFLFLNSSEVPGNAGLQDQIQAIRWINDNIENFGGDPKRITLFGESAGSISCEFHLTNMNIQDLFQNAILESGPMAMPAITSSEDQALSNTLTLIKNVNCMAGDTAQMLKCLRNKSTDELMANYLKVPDYLALIFVPVRNGLEVPISPSTAAAEIPSNKRKNILAGTITREMGGFFDYLFPGKEFNEDMVISENDLRNFFEIAYQLYDKTLQDLLILEYKNPSERYNSSQLRVLASDMLSDNGFICAQLDFAKSWVSPTNKVFYYNFKHRPSVYLKGKIPQWAGAIHGDEIPFVFGLPLYSKYGYTRQEQALSRQMMTIWANFAKSGDPNIGSKKQLGRWPKLEQNHPFQYLDIDDVSLTVRTFYKDRQCEFWKTIFPGLLQIQGQLMKEK